PHEDLAALDRHLELYRLEQVGPRAREDRDAVRLGARPGVEPGQDALDVPLETLALGRALRIRGRARPELRAHEGAVLVTPDLVGTRVDVDADEWPLSRRKVRQAIDERLEIHGRYLPAIAEML